MQIDLRNDECRIDAVHDRDLNIYRADDPENNDVVVLLTSAFTPIGLSKLAIHLTLDQARALKEKL